MTAVPQVHDDVVARARGMQDLVRAEAGESERFVRDGQRGGDPR
jgi:hypothetical protein